MDLISKMILGVLIARVLFNKGEEVMPAHGGSGITVDVIVVILGVDAEELLIAPMGVVISAHSATGIPECRTEEGILDQRSLVAIFHDLANEHRAVIIDLVGSTVHTNTIQRVQIDHGESALVKGLCGVPGDLQVQFASGNRGDHTVVAINMLDLFSCLMGNRFRACPSALSDHEAIDIILKLNDLLADQNKRGGSGLEAVVRGDTLCRLHGGQEIRVSGDVLCQGKGLQHAQILLPLGVSQNTVAIVADVEGVGVQAGLDAHIFQHIGNIFLKLFCAVIPLELKVTLPEIQLALVEIHLVDTQSLVKIQSLVNIFLGGLKIDQIVAEIRPGIPTPCAADLGHQTFIGVDGQTGLLNDLLLLNNGGNNKGKSAAGMAQMAEHLTAGFQRLAVGEIHGIHPIGQRHTASAGVFLIHIIVCILGIAQNAFIAICRQGACHRKDKIVLICIHLHGICPGGRGQGHQISLQRNLCGNDGIALGILQVKKVCLFFPDVLAGCLVDDL